MRDFATQMLPEPLNRIELGRVGRQTGQFNLVLMSLQKGLHGLGEVNAEQLRKNDEDRPEDPGMWLIHD